MDRKEAWFENSSQDRQSHWYGLQKQSQVYLENPHEEGHRGGHQDSLLVLGQTLKACDIGWWSVLWDQTGHHGTYHQAQDWEGAWG